jgi:hypothetical protein
MIKTIPMYLELVDSLVVALGHENDGLSAVRND